MDYLNVFRNFLFNLRFRLIFIKWKCLHCSMTYGATSTTDFWLCGCWWCYRHYQAPDSNLWITQVLYEKRFGKDKSFFSITRGEKNHLRVEK